MAKVTITSDINIDVVFALGATSQYVDGPVKEFYPAINLLTIQLPNVVKFQSVFRLLGEPSLSNSGLAKARALEVLTDIICQGVTDATLETYAVEV